MNESKESQDSSNVDDGEISLIDLIKIMVRRWKLMAMIFLVFVLGVFIYTLMAERNFEYVSIYQVAEQSPRDSQDLGALEAPITVVAKVSNLYVGEVIRELRSAENLERLPFDVSISNPSDTLLIRLSSEASETNGTLVDMLHVNLLMRIKLDQQAQTDRRRLSLERQLESAQRSLDAAKESSSAAAAELIAINSNRVAELEDHLALLKEGQVAQTAVRSLEPVGTGRGLIMGLAIVLGAMLAITGAFVTQFFVAVRTSIKKEGARQCHYRG